MALWKDTNGQIHDDMDGKALSLDSWPKGMTQVTSQEAEAQIQTNTQNLFNSLSYQEKRKSEYPNILDYLDGVVKGDQAQIQAYIDACKAVKLKYPKV